LLINQLDSQKALIVLHDLDVTIFIVHIEAVFTVLDQIRQLILGNFQKIEERSVLANLCLSENRRNYQANEHYYAI
jgi:hypothetical protein